MDFLDRFNHAVVDTPCDGVSMTDPQFARECDINEVIRRYGMGLAPKTVAGQSGDFSDIGDYQACLEKVLAVDRYFADLPAELRKRFGHDSSAFAEFVRNPQNLEECIKLGILSREVKSESAVEVLQDIRKSVTPKGESV